MKEGILATKKHKINFQDITKIENIPIDNILIITYTCNNKVSTQAIFCDRDINKIKIIAELIKEYADSNGFTNIEYKNCLLKRNSIL